MNHSFNMGPATATDVRDRLFKSMHGNATIIEQKGPKLVYSVEQRKALELMTIVEEKCPIAQRGGQDTVQRNLTSEKGPLLNIYPLLLFLHKYPQKGSLFGPIYDIVQLK